MYISGKVVSITQTNVQCSVVGFKVFLYRFVFVDKHWRVLVYALRSTTLDNIEFLAISDIHIATQLVNGYFVEFFRIHFAGHVVRDRRVREAEFKCEFHWIVLVG